MENFHAHSEDKSVNGKLCGQYIDLWESEKIEPSENVDEKWKHSLFFGSVYTFG